MSKSYAFVFIVLFCFGNVAGQKATSQEIIEGLQEVKKGYEYLLYGLDYVEAFKEDNTPPEFPSYIFSSSQHIKALKTEINLVNNVELNSDYEFFKINELRNKIHTELDLNTKGQYYLLLQGEIQKAQLIVEENNKVLLFFNNQVQLITKCKQLLALSTQEFMEIGEKLGAVSTFSPAHELGLELYLMALELEDKYRPVISALQTEYKKRLEYLRNSSVNFSDSLTYFKSRLNQDIALELLTYDNKKKVLQAQLDSLNIFFNSLRSEISVQEDRKAELMELSVEALKLQDIKKSILDSVVVKAKSLDEETELLNSSKKTYNSYNYTGDIGCPERYSYDKCKHETKKSRYLNKKLEYKELLDNQIEKVAKIRRQLSELNARIETLNKRQVVIENKAMSIKNVMSSYTSKVNHAVDLFVEKSKEKSSLEQHIVLLNRISY